MATTRWAPSEVLTPDDALKASEEILARPDIPMTEDEDIIRIRELGLDWDICLTVYQPKDPAKIPTGADGRKCGIFLLHGEGEDHRSQNAIARLLVKKYGYKVTAMSCLGRYNLNDPSRDWPGQTHYPDGTARTPIWKAGETVAREEYELAQDMSLRMQYGTRFVVRAKPDTPFWHRMASWPIAFDEGMRALCAKHFPQPTYSIYVHAHSAGGSLGCILMQRVPNVAGAIAMEDSPFGYINVARDALSGGMGRVAGYEPPKVEKVRRKDPFNELYLYDWRYKAVRLGGEALAKEGPNALMRLPWLMEQVFEAWESMKHYPNFKAEYPVTHEVIPSLTQAAQVTAKRLCMNKDETEALIQRYLGYSRELSGSDVKPMPPQLFLVSTGRNHSPQSYREVTLPMYAAMKPAPKCALVHIRAGVHYYMTPIEGMPSGTGPLVTKTWTDAIMGGWFLTN
jgi:hypothetical protein